MEKNFNPKTIWLYYLDYQFCKRRRKRRRGTRREKVEEEKRERRGSKEKGGRRRRQRERGGMGRRGKTGPHHMLNMAYLFQPFK